MPGEVHRNENYTAPVRTFSINGPFRKLTLNGGLKMQFTPNLRQYCHAGLDSNRGTNNRKITYLGVSICCIELHAR